MDTIACPASIGEDVNYHYYTSLDVRIEQDSAPKNHFEGKVDRALRMKVSKAMEISVWVRVGHSFLYPYSLENGQKEMLLGRLGEVLDYPRMNLKNYD